MGEVRVEMREGPVRQSRELEARVAENHATDEILDGFTMLPGGPDSSRLGQSLESESEPLRPVRLEADNLNKSSNLQPVRRES